jgi:hypothetical protein
VAGGRITAAECGGEYAVDLHEAAAGSICLTALNAHAARCDGRRKPGRPRCRALDGWGSLKSGAETGELVTFGRNWKKSLT